MGYANNPLRSSSPQRRPRGRAVLARQAPRRRSARRARSLRGYTDSGLGIFGLDRLIEWGGGKAIDAIAGGAEGGDVKAQRALSSGGAQPGAYNERQLLDAIQNVGSHHPVVSSLRRKVTAKDWLQGVGIETNNAALARAAVFLAHGGQDGKQGATEAAVEEGVRIVLREAGASVLPTPQYVRMEPDYVDSVRRVAGGAVDALQDRFLSPRDSSGGTVAQRFEQAQRSPYFWPAVAGISYLVLKAR